MNTNRNRQNIGSMKSLTSKLYLYFPGFLHYSQNKTFLIGTSILFDVISYIKKEPVEGLAGFQDG